MSRMPPDRAPATPRSLTNNRWVNFPAVDGNGVITVDRNKISAVQDAFDDKGQPIIGASYVHLDNQTAFPVSVGRHTVITTLLMAEQGVHSDDKPTLAS